MEVLGCILVVLFGLAISPILNGFANKFVEEDKLEEQNKKEKVKLAPKVDIKVALVTAISELALFVTLGVTVNFFIYAFLMLLLIICMFADIRGCIIPNEVNFVGFIAGIIIAFAKFTINVQEGLSLIGGMIIGLVIFLAIAGFSLLVFKKEGMGGGDIKLMGVIGLYMGFLNNIQIFILSFLVAAIISIVLLATKKKSGDDYIPFGPFIVIAVFITMLFPASSVMPAIIELLG